jgi:hypothetical protein
VVGMAGKDRQIRVVHRWEDGCELTPRELAERREAFSLALAEEWGRARGYKMTVAKRLEAAAGE